MIENMLNITVTQNAIKHIKKVIASKSGSIGFRITMKKYGCNGYGYVPEVVAESFDNDIELPISSNFRFFVDKKFEKYLQNTEIDYVVKNLGQEMLVFRNPNTEGECGCGESVNLKKDDSDD